MSGQSTEAGAGGGSRPSADQRNLPFRTRGLANSVVTVAVIFGGRSTEHDVSCRSAAAVLRHLDRTRYEIVPIRITVDGVGLVGADRPGEPVEVTTLREMTPDRPDRPGTPVESMVEAPATLRPVDVVLPCLHGPYGEDGTLQSVLEFADGLPRQSAGRAQVAIHGTRCPVVGRIAMDQVVVDVGDLPTRPGDLAVMLGPGTDGEPTAGEWADWAGTDPNDILTGIGPRLPRRYGPVR